MRITRLLLLAVLAALALPLPPTGSAAPAPAVPTLVGIRAAHHPGFDRVVFEFRGGLPASRRVRYVDRLRADASGLPVRIAGRAVLRVRFEAARAHDAQGPTVPGRTAFALPDVLTTVRAGDFESVTTYGIGLAKRTPFQVSTLRHPSRVVIDVRAAFATVNRKVWFLDRDRVRAGKQPVVTSTLRPIRAAAPGTGLMDRLFAGPSTSEKAAGLRFLRSGADGFSHLSVTDGVVRVRLTGGCTSHGSTVTIADQIRPTLRQLAAVRWVKVYDPTGHTERPTGHSDSIPTCLEP